MTDWAPLLGGIASGVGSYMGASASAGAQRYIANIQEQIAKLQLSGTRYTADIQRLTALQTAAMQYPGQMATGQSLADYLEEKIGTGLTEEEKSGYRASGKAEIERGISGALEETETTYASQGLKGGGVAGALGEISGLRPGLYGDLESKIMEADIGARENTVAQALAFLQTKAAPQGPGGGYATPQAPPGGGGGGGYATPQAPPGGGGGGGYQPISIGAGKGVVGGRFGGATPFTQPLQSYGFGGQGGQGGQGNNSIAQALAALAANPNISSSMFRHRADILRGVEYKDPQRYYQGAFMPSAQRSMNLAHKDFTNPYQKIGAGGTWSY